MGRIIEEVRTEPVNCGNGLPRDGSTIFGIRVVNEHWVLRAFMHAEVRPDLIRNYEVSFLLSGPN